MENNNMLLTKENFIKESFNAKDFMQEGISFSTKLKFTNRFLFYFMQILQMVFKFGVIGEEERNFIAELLGDQIEKMAEGNPLRAANYLYVITLWLRSMPQYEAWKHLSKVKNQKEAVAFLNKALSWFYKEVDEILIELNRLKGKVVSLKEKNILQAFQTLEQDIKELKKLQVDLTSMHEAPIALAYNLMTQPEGTDYLRRLEKTVDYFGVEVSILCKMDAKTILCKKRQERKNHQKEEGFDLETALETELENLKEEYEQKMKLSFEKQRAYEGELNDLEKVFAKEHPNLTEEELERAFDEYLDELPEEFFDDVTYEDTAQIKNWYDNQKAGIIERFEMKEKQLEKKVEKENMFEIEDDSLFSLIKEFALFFLAQKQSIAYPSNPKEKSEMLSHIPMKMAIPIFIKEIDICFSEVESCYLIAAK